MTDLIGALTALCAVLIVAASIGALVLVMTGAPLPTLRKPNAPQPRPLAVATVSAQNGNITLDPSAVTTTTTPAPDLDPAADQTSDDGAS